MVIVLIILTLLAVIAVGFLSSMTAERTTAAAYANKTKAEHAAQAGADTAMATLRQCFGSFPDSCTAWDTQQSTNQTTGAAGNPYNAGTTLYFRAVAPVPSATDENRPPMLVAGAGSADPRKIYALPLVSGVIGGVAQLEPSKSKALPVLNIDEPDKAKQNFVDLNAPRYQGDPEGWIGSPPGHADVNAKGQPAPRPVRAPWVEIKGADGTVNGRYAFWTEDESFRVNINTADLGNPADPHQRRDNQNNPAAGDALGLIGSRDVDLAGLFEAINEKGGPATSPSAAAADESQNAGLLLNLRKTYPSALFPEPLGYRHANFANAAANPLRFLTTTTSGGLNLSRHGSQRLNLNAIIPTRTDATKTATVQSQIDQVVQTIRFHAPNFGQRFYRKTAEQTPGALNAFDVGADDAGDHSLIYLYKVAANIRDYIDDDCLPTIISPGGKVAEVAKPLLSFDPAPWAAGKDAAPFIQECAVVFRGDVKAGQYTLLIDYYIEVWNMSTRTINGSDLGPSPFIRIASPPPWFATFNNSAGDRNFTDLVSLIPDDGGPNPSTSRTEPRHLQDFDIDLSQAVFPAGQVTVITTDTLSNHSGAPDYKERDANDVIRKDTEASRHVVGCDWVAPGKSVFHGKMPDGLRRGTTNPAPTDTIRLKFEDGNSTDYQTNIIFGNANGYIDSLETLPMSYSGGDTGFRFPDPKAPYGPLGGYLRGNWTNTGAGDGLVASAVGDPRANNEQLITLQDEGGADATRYKNYVAQAAHAPLPVHPSSPSGVLPTLGLPNYMSTRPNRPGNPWPDLPPYYKDPNASPTPASAEFAAELILRPELAPGIMANAPLTSIGQLGDIYDPARILASPSAVDRSRGGGRTFKVGQHDDRWDGNETNKSASREWTSWRLLDFFSVADHSTLTTGASTLPGQPRMIDQPGIGQPGLINVNGVARDGGAALKAALLGIAFQPPPQGDRAFNAAINPSFHAPAIQAVADQAVARLTTPITDPATLAVNVGGKYQTGAGPFWERGEFSELPVFGRTHSTTPPTDYGQTDLAGIDLSTRAFDRGREELFRRLVEMTTTRGDTFTVYVAGQAVQQKTPAGPKTYSATHRLKVTFRLQPKGVTDPATGLAREFAPGTDDLGRSVPFDGSATGNLEQRLKDRFAKPDHYEIQVLSAVSGL